MSVSTNEVLAFFFRPQGRIPRGEFVLGVLLLYALSLVLVTFMYLHTSMEGLALLVGMALGIILTVAQIMLVVKRCHDIALPGSFVVLLFIPLVGLAWLVALLFIPGTAGPNLYGPEPAYRKG